MIFKSHTDRIVYGALLVGLLLITGCLCDSPNDDNIPWNRPDPKDAMIPLPNSLINRYD